MLGTKKISDRRRCADNAYNPLLEYNSNPSDLGQVHRSRIHVYIHPKICRSLTQSLNFRRLCSYTVTAFLSCDVDEMLPELFFLIWSGRITYRLSLSSHSTALVAWMSHRVRDWNGGLHSTGQLVLDSRCLALLCQCVGTYCPLVSTGIQFATRPSLWFRFKWNFNTQ